MAQDLATIELSMRSIIALEPWKSDARCAPIPWREDIFKQTLHNRLTIGVLRDDGKVRPHPPILRVLNQVIDRLRDAGHDIVEWNADLHVECIEVMVSPPFSSRSQVLNPSRTSFILLMAGRISVTTSQLEESQ